MFPSSTTTPQGMYRFSSDHRSQVLKSSPVGRGEYLAGRPLGNTPCCRLFGHLFWSNFTFPRQPVFGFFVVVVVVVQLCNAERELKMAATDVCF